MQWSNGKHILNGFWMFSVCVWWGYVSDRPNQGTRLALTLFVNGLFPRIILIRASQDLRCSSARWLLQCWWMGIAFRLIAAPCFDNLPQLTGERAAATFTNWTDYCKMFFSSLESAGWRQRGSSVACTQDLMSYILSDMSCLAGIEGIQPRRVVSMCGSVEAKQDTHRN